MATNHEFMANNHEFLSQFVPTFRFQTLVLVQHAFFFSIKFGKIMECIPSEVRKWSRIKHLSQNLRTSLSNQ